MQKAYEFPDFMKERMEEFVFNLESEIILRSSKKLKKMGYTEEEIDFYFTKLDKKSPEEVETRQKGKDREELPRMTRLMDDSSKIYPVIQKLLIKTILENNNS